MSTIQRISVSSDGKQGNAPSGESGLLRAQFSVNADGRKIAFASLASNLVPKDTNNQSDVFVHDTVTGVTSRVSVSNKGYQLRQRNYEPDISANGMRVTFSTGSFWKNRTREIMMRDLGASSTIIVSASPYGKKGKDYSSSPIISGDGHYVAFNSQAINLIPERDDLSRWRDRLYIKDLEAGIVQLVEEDSAVSWSDGQQFVARHLDGLSTMYSFQGQRIGTFSDADWRTQNEAIKRAIMMSLSAEIQPSEPSRIQIQASSADARYIIFLVRYNADRIQANPQLNVVANNLFVYDSVEVKLRPLSVNSRGEYANAKCMKPVFSGDGTKVAFVSEASNLVPNDTNGVSDIFLVDLKEVFDEE